MNNELIEKILRVKRVTCTPEELYDLAAELTLANKKLELLQASNDHYADMRRWQLSNRLIGDADLYEPIEEDDIMLTHGYDFARKAQEEIARLEGKL